AEQTRAIVDATVDAGITLFDTSENYGSPPGESQRLLGEALKGRRQDVVISTKVGGFTLRKPGLAPASRRAIRMTVEESLKRLHTDFLDLLYLHQPDGLTPMEEILAAMDELVDEGKVRYIGSANLLAWQVVEAELLARLSGGSRFIASQNAYSLID